MEQPNAARMGRSDGTVSLMRTFVCASTFFVLQLAVGQSKQTWPKVQPFSHEWHILDASKADTPVLAYIRDVAGQPAYKLECHSGLYEDESKINFSGTYQCALFAFKDGHRASWNLLADRNHRDTDWNNRGRMMAQQLEESCGDTPGYGTHRVFMLRGMRLELVFKDLKWESASGTQAGERQLNSFTFVATAQPDSKAWSPQAAPTKTPPPSSCSW